MPKPSAILFIDFQHSLMAHGAGVILCSILATIIRQTATPKRFPIFRRQKPNQKPNPRSGARLVAGGSAGWEKDGCEDTWLESFSHLTLA